MYRVTVAQGQTQFDYDVDAPDEETAKAFAFRAHNVNRAWGDRAEVRACVTLDQTVVLETTAQPATLQTVEVAAVDVNGPNPAVFVEMR